MKYLPSLPVLGIVVLALAFLAAAFAAGAFFGQERIKTLRPIPRAVVDHFTSKVVQLQGKRELSVSLGADIWSCDDNNIQWAVVWGDGGEGETHFFSDDGSLIGSYLNLDYALPKSEKHKLKSGDVPQGTTLQRCEKVLSSSQAG